MTSQEPHTGEEGNTASGVATPAADQSRGNKRVAKTPTDLSEAGALRLECGRVDVRRRALHISQVDPSVGLALSGGGIRSATVCLGIIRAMAKHNALPKVDYLSSVSGGGYAGSFLCSLYARDVANPQVQDASRHNPAGDDERWREALDYLRQGGRYLVPSGAQDAIHGVAIAIRNWVAVHLVIGTTIVAIVLGLDALRVYLWAGGSLTGVEAAMAANGVPPILWPTTWIDASGSRDYPLSWLWPLTLLPFALAVGCGWAFWLGLRAYVWRWRPLRLLSVQTAGALCVVMLALSLLWSPDCSAASERAVACTISSSFAGASSLILAAGFLSLLAVLLYLLAEALDSRRCKDRPRDLPVLSDDPKLIAEEDRVRGTLSAWTSRWLTVSLLVAGAALVDTVGNYFYTWLRTGSPIQAIGIPTLTTAAIVAALRQVVRRIPTTWRSLPGSPSFGDFLRRFGRQLALVLGLLLVLALFAFWASLAHVIAWRLEPLGSLEGWGGDPLFAAGAIAWVTAAFAILAWLMGISIPFLNLSSFSAFYAGRLRRAYLGASHRLRHEAATPADKDHQGDDLSLHYYYDPRSLAPIHLINVTINQTTSRGSRILLRDRKGKPLIVSPNGYLYAGASTSGEMNVAPLDSGEQMPLSSWIGISGAAFSTGVGQNTSLGQSLIAGLANMRLGYWWDAPRPSAWAGVGLRMLFPVQSYLLREFRASFEGTEARRWYLSDGGHFENTGAYALLRRRVDLVLVCDSGADPDYQYDDMVNLLRKARIDLGVQIEFLTSDGLNAELGENSPLRTAFGTLDDLASLTPTNKPGPYAALAKITYPATESLEASEGTLVLLKPRLCGVEARDILRYAKLNKSFPQQSTLDQFFDEAQWESYYELGRRMADAIFDPAKAPEDDQYWSPSSMKPLSARRTTAERD